MKGTECCAGVLVVLLCAPGTCPSGEQGLPCTLFPPASHTLITCNLLPSIARTVPCSWHAVQDGTGAAVSCVCASSVGRGWAALTRLCSVEKESKTFQHCPGSMVFPRSSHLLVVSLGLWTELPALIAGVPAVCAQPALILAHFQVPDESSEDIISYSVI